MKEKTLLKLALICSLIGIFILYVASEKISIDEVEISKITDEKIGNSVKLIGRVEKISDIGKIMFLDIGQEKIESVTVVLFKDSNISLSEGNYVEVIGTLEDYEGEKEVIANRIRII